MLRKPILRKTPIKRKSTSILRKKRIPAMSPKRKKEIRIYSQKRKEFLAARPWCEVWLSEHGLTFDDVNDYGYATVNGLKLCAPRATEVHHREKRNGNYLKEDTWMAVSSFNHWRIEQNKNWARSQGYLK